MSIVELLKSVDTLAKVIHQKNLELEELKRGYDSKLREINKYIEVLHKQENIEDGPQVNEKDFRDIIREPVKCEKCDHTIWNMDEESDFIIMPKRKLQYILKKDNRESIEKLLDRLDRESLSAPDSEDKSKIRQSTVGDNMQTTAPKAYRKHYNKSKKTCSYCSKPGHSRAHCMVRLTNPKPTSH